MAMSRVNTRFLASEYPVKVKRICGHACKNWPMTPKTCDKTVNGVPALVMNTPLRLVPKEMLTALASTSSKRTQYSSVPAAKRAARLRPQCGDGICCSVSSSYQVTPVAWDGDSNTSYHFLKFMLYL